MRGAVIAIAVAGLAGYLLGASRTAPEPQVREQAVVKDSRPLDDQAMRMAVRAAVRDEVRTARVDAPAPAPVAEPAVAVEPSRERLDAEALIASAVGSGRWREEDRDRLTVLAGKLSGVERDEVVRPLVVAINAQRVALDFVGPWL